MGKESAYNPTHLGSIPVSGRSPREGNGNPLQYSCLENPMDKGAWWATVHSVSKSQTRLNRLSMHAQHCISFQVVQHKLSVSHSVVSDTLPPHGLNPARLLCPWNFPGKNTGVGCHALLYGIFPTQGLNPGLLHCRQILYRLSRHIMTWYLHILQDDHHNKSS